MSQKYNGTVIAIQWVEVAVMQTARIPWRIFLDALGNQSHCGLEGWLLRWRFSNEGVYTAERKSKFRREHRAGDDSIHVSTEVQANKRGSDENGRQEI